MGGPRKKVVAPKDRQPYTAEEALLLVGTVRLVKIERWDISFPAVITNIRHRYGHVDVLVVPMLGTGSTWVSVDRTASIEPVEGAEMPDWMAMLSAPAIERLAAEVEEACGLALAPS